MPPPPKGTLSPGLWQPPAGVGEDASFPHIQIDVSAHALGDVVMVTVHEEHGCGIAGKQDGGSGSDAGVGRDSGSAVKNLMTSDPDDKAKRYPNDAVHPEQAVLAIREGKDE